MAYKFLIVDKVHESLFPMLENMDISYDYKNNFSREDIINSIADYEGLIIRSKTRVDHELLQNAAKLKVVCRAGAGIDNLDEKLLDKRNIKVINAPEGNRDTVAEHCMGLLLNLFSRISIADRQVRDKIWAREGNRGIELKGKTVAIIGYGNMGSAFAERLKSFGCRILVYDKYKNGFSNDFVEEVKLEDIFHDADVLSLHIPLTNATKGWINRDFINNFRKPVYIINTSRGEVLPLKDLVELLKTGKVAGAALDVLENEKLNKLNIEQNIFFEYLISSDKVILTPHIAGWSVESYKRINEVLIEKLKKWVSQKPLNLT